MTGREPEPVPDIVARCMFVNTCRVTVTGHDPGDVHHRMEAHYYARHRDAIERITGNPYHQPGERHVNR